MTILSNDVDPFPPNYKLAFVCHSMDDQTGDDLPYML